MTDPSAAPDAPVFDKAGLYSRLMDDADLVRSVLEIFLSDMPGQLDALDAAVAAGDRETAERLAHSVKGAASNVGGEAFRHAARDIEDRAHVGDLATLAPALVELRTQFGRLREVMAGEV